MNIFILVSNAKRNVQNIRFVESETERIHPHLKARA